jgi:dTDP-4-amino-4,6-dideoxygalactose transaminase
MDSLQAAILNVKLPHLQAWTKLRRQHAAHYDTLLASIPHLVCPAVRKGCQHAFHLYVIRADNREMLRAHLKAEEIPTLVNYPKALPFYPAYARLNHIREDYPVACKHSEEILSLPLYPEMPATDRVQIAQRVAAYYSSASNTHKYVA